MIVRQLAAVATRIQPTQTLAPGVWSWATLTPHRISKLSFAAVSQVRPSTAAGHQPAVKIGIQILSTPGGLSTGYVWEKLRNNKPLARYSYVARPP